MQGATRRGRARSVALATIVLAVTGGAWSWGPPASAAGVFTVRANAYPVQSTATNGTIPVTAGGEGYGPFARTNLDSLGSSDALAGAPYFGDVVAGASGLVQSVSGVQAPDYPFFVVTAAGEEPKEVNYPGSALRAESRGSAAVAKAVQGDDASGASASARSEQLADNSVQATAESTSDVLQLGGNATVRGLRTLTRVTADGTTGKLTRESSLVFNSFTAPGAAYQTPCKVPPQLPGAGSALPCAKTVSPEFSFKDGQFFLRGPDGAAQKIPVDSTGVANAFKSIGVTFRYQKPQNTSTGLVGAGMTFSYTSPEVPDNASGFEGAVTSTFTAGFSTVSASLRVVPGAFEGFNPGGVVNPGGQAATDPSAATPFSTGGGAPAAPSLSDIGAVPVDEPGAPAVTPDLAAALGGANPGVAPATADPLQADQPAPASAPAVLAAQALSVRGVENIYLVLVGTAVVAFLAVSTLRILGVRAQWTS